jgi:hypothetical protein
METAVLKVEPDRQPTLVPQESRSRFADGISPAQALRRGDMRKTMLTAIGLLLMAAGAGAETNTWTGTGNWTNVAGWSLSHVPLDGEDAVLAASVTLSNSPARLASLTVNGGATLTFQGWWTIATADVVIIQGTVTHTASAVTTTNLDGTWPQDHRVWIVASNLTVNGSINVDARGYQGTSSAGRGPGYSGFDRGAAGHGGRGATYQAGTYGGPAYGVANAPEALGSSGNANYGSTGGSGGGAVRIDAAGLVMVNGIVTANGAYTTQAGNCGGGAGGSVFITCATLGGTNGAIRADGGSGTGGGGGGGRVAIVCTDPAAQAPRPRPIMGFSALRGSGGNALMEHGTVYVSDSSLLPYEMVGMNGRLVGLPSWSFTFPYLSLSNSWLLFPAGLTNFWITVTNDLRLNASTLDVDGTATWRSSSLGLMVGGDLILTNSSALYVYAGPTNPGVLDFGSTLAVTGTLSLASNCFLYPTCNGTNGATVRLVASNVTVAAYGGINANSRGYAGKTGGLGAGPGRSTVTGRAGAGYGGRGGDAWQANQGGPIYGNTNAPAHPGSSGGSDDGDTGGSGGGLVRIDATDRIQLDGTISANGGNGNHDTGTGSGGGIYLQTRNIAGGGAITANGGSTGGTSGGGGGGRIAVYFRADLFGGTNRVSALGGTGAGALNLASNGTVVWVSTATNDLNLAVSGDPARHGASAPYDYGNNPVALGSPVTCTVNTPADASADTRYACIGFVLSNLTSVVASGPSNSVSFMMDTNLYLVWRWTTEYYLATSSATNGSLQADRTGWYTNATPVTVTPQPAGGYSFLQWTGPGVPAGRHWDNPLTVTMDQPRTFTARFSDTTPDWKIWTGTADWFSWTNWQPAGIPDPGDTVVVSNGACSLGDPTRVAALRVGGSGTLRLQSGQLDVAGSIALGGAASVTEVSNGVLRCGGNLVLGDSARLYARGGLWTLPDAYSDSMTNCAEAHAGLIDVGGEMLVPTNCTVYCYAHPTNGGTTLFRVSRLTVDLGGRFYADQSGYAGGWASYGPGRPAGGNTRGGAGHGGRGGDSLGELGGGTYGSSNYPVQAGSGSSDPYTGGGKYGGGAIRVVAGRRVTVNGTLTANGGNGGGNPGGSAGGTIFVSAPLFNGAGSLSARGGDSTGLPGGGGGGGRIAIWCGGNGFTGSLDTNSVRGGGVTGSPGSNGTAGTLVFGRLPYAGTIFFVR